MARRKKNVSALVVRTQPIIQEVVSQAPKSSARARRNRRRRARRRGGGVLRRSGPGNLGLTMSYLRSLADPFDVPGPRIGWGCLQPTQVGSSYARFTVTSNADGSAAIVAVPAVIGLIQTNVAGVSTATWTTANSTDHNTVSANYGAGRPISLGVRAFPSIPATSAPGQVIVGALPMQSVSTLQGLTTTDLLSFPTSHVYCGYQGASATGRPTDPTSFQFNPACVNSTGFTSTTVIPFSLPYIAFAGLPASSTIFCEVVFNYEALPELVHGGAPMSAGDQQQAGPTLADEWPSLEQMWSTIKQYLPTPGQPDETSASKWNLQNSRLVTGAARLGLSALRAGGYARGRALGPMMDMADTFLASN